MMCAAEYTSCPVIFPPPFGVQLNWSAHGVLGDFSSTEAKIVQCEKLEGGREPDLPHDILVALVRMQEIIGRPGLKPD
jgi:hypothetical protein